ncbi:MAG: hypothetical protein O2958_02910 [Gemmatimonadetes bacterium]|nr:hypothetical protein [Gemmatimonadota bacterium]MDA1102267.1 hypothetical protein [Gemmatimonadota bacterium]
MRTLRYLTLFAVWASPIAGQAVQDPARLAGVVRVQVRADAVWDEQITVSAGGATPEQFVEALRQSFASSIASADAAPSIVPGAPNTVACHVDTFYESGLIVYALRVHAERPGADGAPVITWIKSWVGSYSVQQLHLMFRLGEQCAESFLADWKSVNE